MARSHAGRDDTRGSQWPETWAKMVQPLTCQIGRPGNKPDRPGDRIRILPVEGRPTRRRLNLTVDAAGDRPLCLNSSELLPIFNRARQATTPCPKYHPTDRAHRHATHPLHQTSRSALQAGSARPRHDGTRDQETRAAALVSRGGRANGRRRGNFTQETGRGRRARYTRWHRKGPQLPFAWRGVSFCGEKRAGRAARVCSSV